MPRFAANLSMLWPELDPYARFRAAHEAGFRHVEMLFPHELDVDRVEGLIEELGLEMVLFDSAPGDWKAGERGLLCVPGREDELLQTLVDALEVARRVRSTRINILAGVLPDGVPADLGEETVVRNLSRAAGLVAGSEVRFLLEAINNVDMPGYFVSTVGQAASLVRRVGAASVGLLFDQYHIGMVGEDPVGALAECLPLIRHVQIADVPGRHQPGTGHQPISRFLGELDACGYAGFVGLEYRPLGPTETSLKWLEEWGGDEPSRSRSSGTGR